MKFTAKFEIDHDKLNKFILEETEKAFSDKEFEVSCPFCSYTFDAKPGRIICPECQKPTDFSLKVSLEK